MGFHLPEPGIHQPPIGTVVHAGTVGCQIGPFGDHIESGKQGDRRIEHEVHDMALALSAQQLQRQQTAYSLLGRNHLRAG